MKGEREMETKLDVKEEKGVGILDLYSKLEYMESKYVFLTRAAINELNRLIDENNDYEDQIITGLQNTMFSLGDEFKEVDIMLDALLDRQRLFESAEARLKAGILNSEDIDNAKKFLDHINELKVRAEGVLKKGAKVN